MNTDFISAVFRRLRPESNRQSEGNHEDIVLWARQRVASDFPNPTRQDCPDSETLSYFVDRGQFPDANLKSHILSCSNCFVEYRTALAAQHQKVSPTLRANEVKPLIGLRSAFALVLILLVGTVIGVILWSRHESSERYVRQVPPPFVSPLATPSPSISSEPTPEVETGRPPRNNDVVAVNAVNIDLAAFAQLRDASDKNKRAIQLKRAVNELVIKLPGLSPQGVYRITFADSFGKQVLSSSATLNAGRVIRTKFNLLSVTEGTYMLCISSNDEVPDCVPARVSGR